MTKPGKGPGRGLTAKQQRFVEEYLADENMNATKAAIRAGYSKRSATQCAHENMKKPEIAAAIAAAIDERSKRNRIDQDYVLRQAVKLHERCMQEIEPFTDRQGNHVHDEKGRPLYLFNATGAARALELVGKHVAVQAFKEKVEHSGAITLNISPEDAEP